MTDAPCNGEASSEIEISITGGTSPYEYLWSNGETTQDLIGVIAGEYTLTITDANSYTHIINATTTEPTAFALTSTIADATCFNENSGQIDISVLGGTATYTYLWPNESTVESLQMVMSGSYNV